MKLQNGDKSVAEMFCIVVHLYVVLTNIGFRRQRFVCLFGS